MEDTQFKYACQPWMQEGLKELEIQKAPGVYTTKEVIDLESTADGCVWEPSDYIREAVPNVDTIEVEFIREGYLNEINKKLMKQGQVGLVVMGTDVSRNSRPSLIILTTDEKLYAIDATKEGDVGIRFLDLKLRDKNLEFWTTDGVNEADSLYNNYKIDLMERSANCCTGLHMHIMKTMRYKTESGLSMYPTLAAKQCRYPLKMEKFADLIEIWLDIPREDIQFDRNQLAHLNTRPLDRTAINIIKKRCLLVQSLIRVMNKYSWLELDIMSRNSFDRLTTCSEQVRKTIIRWMKKRKESGKTDFGYFIHLDTGDGTK